MRLERIALFAATVLATACASDGTTGPKDTVGDTRLAAVATVTSASLSDASRVTLQVTVTSTLSEQVTGGSCASLVQARTASATTWTNVTSSLSVCSANALLLAPRGTALISASADASKLREVASTGTTIVLRVRHTLDGASTSYTMQSNDVSIVVP